jgi:hypothetical protein
MMSRFLLAILLAAGTNLYGQTRADEMVEMWNQIGNKIIAMAKDFPADKYDFKVQPDERTFAQNLLHIAAVDFDLTGRFPARQSDPTSARTSTIPRATFTRRKPVS